MRDDAELVPNPPYEALSALLKDALDMHDEIAQALRKALKLMESGEVWSGPSSGPGTAKHFTKDLQQHREDLPMLAERLVDVIAEERDRTEPLIPVDELPPTVDSGIDYGGSELFE